VVIRAIRGKNLALAFLISAICVHQRQGFVFPELGDVGDPFRVF
jgi:hypothetical protein